MGLPDIPLPTAWITAKPVHQGAISADTFNYTITGLSASTIYQYRAYMVVDGVPYYGDTCQINTGSMPVYSPSVCTGIASGITTNSMDIHQNKVTSNGGLPITEYGVIYTQNSKYGCAACMTYNSINMCMESICSDIPINTNYFEANTCTLSGLYSNANTYFRAFAKNNVGLGYGLVKTEQTEQLDITPITICLNETTNIIGCGSSNGYICANPSLSIGQCAVVNVAVCHYLVGGGTARTRIYCKPNGSSSYIQIYCLENPYEQPLPIQYTNVSILGGDAICWNHCTSGFECSYSFIKTVNVGSYTPDICPTISSTYCCDRIVSPASST